MRDVLTEPQQIRIGLQQLFRLDVAVVEGVDEVERDISRNQIEWRQAPPHDLQVFILPSLVFVSVRGIPF